MFWENDLSNLDSKTFIVDNEKSYTFEEIFTLADLGYKEIPPRTVVLIESGRDLGTVVAYLGALRNRAVPLLIDTNSSRKTLHKLATDYKADFIVSVNNNLIENYKLKHSLNDKFVFQRLKTDSKVPNNQLALLMPTSGSTGEAKCVRISYNNLNEVTYSIMRYMKMDSSRVSISSLHFHYSYGLSVLNLAIASRSKLVLTNHSWIEREFWYLMEKHKVSDLSGVPFMFQTLRRMNLSKEILQNLRCVNQAGGHLEPRSTEYFIDYFAPYSISYLTMYGATEASPRISYVPPDRSKEKLGTVGLPIDIGFLGTDAKDGKSQGELIYRGPNVCLGYALSRDDLTKGDENGQTLKTGDIGFIDDEGFATIVGRKKRFVKVFGMSVNLDSLEAIVQSIVPESVVIGEDNNIKILYVGNMNASLIKEATMSKVTFSHNILKVISIPKLLLNTSGKPDYPLMTKEFL